MLICLLSITGYGGISPRTQWGRIAALLYAFFGIPIVLLYLSTMGQGLSQIMRFIFRRLRSCGSHGNRNDNNSNGSGSNSNTSSTTGIGTINGRSDNNGSIMMDKNYHNTTSFSANPSKCGKLSKSNQNYEMNFNNQSYNYHYHRHLNGVPISICIMILICYVTLGAALFHRLQSWNVLESLYFCFTSLGTIGFGELEPKGYIAQYVASAYILIGMAIVAMCFSLIKSELSMLMRRINGEQSEEKMHATTISGSGNGSGITQSSFTHLLSHHNHQHMMHQIPSNGEDVALVTVAVTPKS